METINFKPCGEITLSNGDKVEIMFNETSDAVIYSKNGKVAKRWSRVKFSRGGDKRRGLAYFTAFGKRFYFKDFVFCR